MLIDCVYDTLNQIAEAQNRGAVKSETKVFALPLTEEKFVAEGAEEPSLDDYEKVPITDYGMAMLRGMNWKEGMPIGKRTKKFVSVVYDTIILCLF